MCVVIVLVNYFVVMCVINYNGCVQKPSSNGYLQENLVQIDYLLRKTFSPVVLILDL